MRTAAPKHCEARSAATSQQSAPSKPCCTPSTVHVSARSLTSPRNRALRVRPRSRVRG